VDVATLSSQLSAYHAENGINAPLQIILQASEQGALQLNSANLPQLVYSQASQYPGNPSAEAGVSTQSNHSSMPGTMPFFAGERVGILPAPMGLPEAQGNAAAEGPQEPATVGIFPAHPAAENATPLYSAGVADSSVALTNNAAPEMLIGSAENDATQGKAKLPPWRMTPAARAKLEEEYDRLSSLVAPDDKAWHKLARSLAEELGCTAGTVSKFFKKRRNALDPNAATTATIKGAGAAGKTGRSKKEKSKVEKPKVEKPRVYVGEKSAVIPDSVYMWAKADFVRFLDRWQVPVGQREVAIAEWARKHGDSTIKHEPAQTFKCTVCTQRFVSNVSLMVHYAQVHATNGGTCTFCLKSFGTSKDRLIHETEDHSQDAADYVATVLQWASSPVHVGNGPFDR